jgi:hypothetical protein
LEGSIPYPKCHQFFSYPDSGTAFCSLITFMVRMQLDRLFRNILPVSLTAETVGGESKIFIQNSQGSHVRNKKRDEKNVKACV